MVFIWILLAVILALALVFFLYFNRFATLENRIENSLSQIDVQLKRRADLIPNLIETVKGYAKHEKAAIDSVTKARSALVSAKDLPARVKADTLLEGALGKLFAIAEAYPDLKANTNFLELQKELSSTEDRVAYARQNYNDSILSFNTLCTTLPGLWFARMFSKKEMKYIEITSEEKKTPKVSF